MTRIAGLFKVKWHEFNLPRFLIFGVILGLLIIVGVLPDDRRYFLSAIFGALLVALSDPGGKHGPRVAKMAVMAAAGALLTALAFSIGAGAWGWVVLAAFVVTLLGGLAVKYGAHALAASIRTMSYTFYTAAVAAAVLIAAGVPDPSNLSHEGRRILFTLAGAGIAIIVLLLAGLLQKRTAKPVTQTPSARQTPRASTT
jgi:hypothetical protein